MRDPARIPLILAKLEKAWLAAPDLRLGQLIDNILHRANCDHPFYIEDDKMEAAIDDWLKKSPPYTLPK